MRCQAVNIYIRLPLYPFISIVIVNRIQICFLIKVGSNNWIRSKHHERKNIIHLNQFKQRFFGRFRIRFLLLLNFGSGSGLHDFLSPWCNRSVELSPPNKLFISSSFNLISPTKNYLGKPKKMFLHKSPGQKSLTTLNY